METLIESPCMTFNFISGLIVRADQIGQTPAKADHVWIFWFGDYRVSQVTYLFHFI